MKKKIFVVLIATCLLVGLLSGCTEEEEEEPTNNAPVASFTFVVDGVNMTVTFTDASTDADGDTLTYSWDFGDENTSDSSGPEIDHTYAANGTYTVTLEVRDETDKDTASETVNINVEEVPVNEPPVANFTYTATNLSIQFNDTSTDDSGIFIWYWDFDDGNTSDEQNPMHNYSAAGTYNVMLRVTDDDPETPLEDTKEIAVEVTE